MNITMSPQQPMLSVTKAIPFQSGIFADVWRVTQERYYQVKKVCRTALINPALICLEQFGVRFLLATFCALFTATLQAADVTITVNGRVVAKPCTIQTKEANVNLGDLYTRNLQQPGSASGWHNITLSLTDCPVETSAVTAIVTGSTDNTGYYKNEGTAENIQIELRDDQDATLKNGDSKTVIVDEITRNAQFPLKARAITVNGNASQGTIEALINVIYTWQ